MTAVYPDPVPNQSPTAEGATRFKPEAPRENELSKKLRELREIILQQSANDLRSFLKDEHNLNLVKDKLDFSDLSATHYAAQRGHLEIVEILVRRKFNCNLQQPSSGKSALHVAVEQGNPEIVRYLIGRPEVDIKLGAYIEIPREDGSMRRCSDNNIMHIAVALKKSELLKKMIKLRKCSDLFDIRNQIDLTPLELAMRMGNQEIFEVFMQHGGQKCIPKSDNFNRFGDSILHWAFKTLSLKFLQSIEILSLRKKDVILTNRHHETLLNNLILLGKHDVIEYIISSLEPKLRFKFVNTPNTKGVTGLVLAVSKEDIKVVQLLIENQADINAKVSSEDFEMTPLMVACKMNEKCDIVSLLVDTKNVHVNAVNILGETALHIVAATRASNSSPVKEKAQAILKSENVNLEMETYDKKYTPIFSAAVHGNVDLFTILLNEPTADIEHCNCNGQTILHVFVMKYEINLCKDILMRYEKSLRKQDSIFFQTIFHIAARTYSTQAQMEVFKSYVENVQAYNPDVLDLRDVNGQTALHKATVARNKEAIGILISAGADTSIKDNVGQTILHLAVLANDTGLFKFLLDKNCDIVRCNKLKQTVLHLAVIVGNRGIVEIILGRKEANALVSKCHLNGRTALHYAVEGESASTEIVKILLNKGIDDSLIDHVGDSALDIAKRNPKNTEIFHLLRETKHDFVHVFSSEIQLNSETIKPAVENLLSTGKKIHLPNRNYDAVDSSTELQLGDSEFKFAKTSNNNDELLYEEIMNQTNVDGFNPLHLAAMDGREQVVKAFLSPLEANHSNSIKTFLSMADLSGNTPVHWAFLNYPVDRKSSDSEFRLLKDYFIKVGCDFNIPNNQNQTVMHIAAALGNRRLFCELLDAGGNPKLPDLSGLNCLHIACKNGHVMIVKELIGRGISLNAFTYDNNSPLHICALYNSSEAAECLLRAGADPTCVNNSNKTPERIAIELSNTNFIRVIWQLNADLKGYLGPKPSVSSRDFYQGQIKHENIKEKFPSIVVEYPKLAETLLDFYLIPLAKDQKHLDEMKIVIDLDLFNTIKVEQNPLISMVFNERSNLLNHPVTKTYLHYKWDRVASYFYYFMALVYLGAASCFTAYLIQIKEDYRNGVSSNSPNTHLQGVEKYYPRGSRAYTFTATGCLCAIPLYVEILVMLLMKTLYLTKTKISNQFQLLYFSSVTAFLIIEYFLIVYFYQVKFEDYIPNEAGWFRNTLVLFSLWAIVGFHVRQSQHFGIYVVMMGKIIATFLKLIIPLSFFLIAPAVCFYILNPLGSEMFETPEVTIYRALYMTVGNYDGDEYKNNLDGWLAGLQAFITIFCLFIVTIVIMNLITAVAIGDVAGAEANANETNLELAANLIIQTEFIRRKAFRHGSHKFEREPQTWELNDSQTFSVTSILQMLWGKAAISKSAIIDQIKSFYLSKYDLNLVDGKEDDIVPTTDTSSKTVAGDLKAKIMKAFGKKRGLDPLMENLEVFPNSLTNQNSQNNQEFVNTERRYLRPSFQTQNNNAYNSTNVSNTFKTFGKSSRVETIITTTSRVFKNF